MPIMAGGDIVVGDDKPSTRKFARRTVERMAERAGARTPKPVPSKVAPVKQEPQKSDLLKPVGAMSQQRSDSGSDSVPQEFVHLVGCCEIGPRAPASPPRNSQPRPTR
jgi:hypothetical protein